MNKIAKQNKAVAAARSTTRPRPASPRSSQTTIANKSPSTRLRKDIAPSGGKIAAITAQLRGPKGASIDELMKITGWQAHSVRGAISGTIRKKQGLTVTSQKSGPVRLYRIADKCAG